MTAQLHYMTVFEFIAQCKKKRVRVVMNNPVTSTSSTFPKGPAVQTGGAYSDPNTGLVSVFNFKVRDLSSPGFGPVLVTKPGSFLGPSSRRVDFATPSFTTCMGLAGILLWIWV